MPVAKPSKRITIKAFAHPPKLPPNFYESTSQQLFEATSSILRHRHEPPALQNCYTSVVNLVSHQFGPRLYHDLVHEFQESCRWVLPSDHDSSSGGSRDLLTFLAQQYPKYVDYLLLVRHVFLALDRPYVWDDVTGTAVKRSSQSTTVLEVGLQQFHRRLCELGWDDEAYTAWWNLLWEAFTTQSTSMLGLLESTMHLWKDLGTARIKVAKTHPLLQSSLEQLSAEWQVKQPYSAEAFLLHVHQQWQYVSTQWTFLPKTWLRALVELHLLEPHLNGEYLLKSMDITHLEHCQRLWNLAARIEGGLPRVLEAVCAHVKQRGLQCIQQPQQQQQQQQLPSQENQPQPQEPPLTPKSVVGGLLELHGQLCSLRAVVGDIPLKPVWADVLNQTPLVAEWLAKYVDLEFKNFKNETSLEPLLYLFTHLQAKDVFEAFYKKDLAKRLLMNRIQSMDLERQFVSLLKTECGTGYTSKMEGMFQDMEWSRESLARYRESPEYLTMRASHPGTGKDAHDTKQGLSSSSSPVDMEVQILTTGYWPVFTQYTNLVLPNELLVPRENFWNYYKKKYQGRKIVWQYALGNCTVSFTASNKTYDLIVSLLQTLVLLCFNERDQWTLPDLMQRIGLEDVEVMERTLLSMTVGKEQFRVLCRKKGPAARDPARSVADDDVFQVNMKFSSNMKRIKIPSMLKKETKKERDKIVESVSRDRLYLIDAVVVRIMKARKTILHQQLIPQVLEQIKVPAQPADIKQRIESLIEREYMERDEKDRTRYNYLA
jgi:cullin 4